MKKYIIALDQGTTSSRAILFDRDGLIIGISQKEFKQYYPQPGWVEHDPMEIWQSQLDVLKELIKANDVRADEIDSVGITNQRETTIVWEKDTGKPVHNAIVWQDRRTAEYCEKLKQQGLAPRVQDKTGLVIDAYFSGTKIKYILDKVDPDRSRAKKGELLFGTVDSWLIYNFTNKKEHVTDTTNASRTMLFNINQLVWDQELLDVMQIPKAMLPTVKECSGSFGAISKDILGFELPITGVAGDQQAALFGQMCTEKGMAKNTYGTGCFLIMNTGTQKITSSHNLLSTIGYTLNGVTNYALEGSVFIGGAIIQWLRDGLELLEAAKQSEEMAHSVDDNGGVIIVPALSGLGAPHWDQFARGSIFGITRGTTKAHIVRAALESIALQVNDVLQAMQADSAQDITELKVDGGAVANNFLLQIQADLIRRNVVRPKILETTALGAAYFAGLHTGFFPSLEELKQQWQVDRIFEPHEEDEKTQNLINLWNRAIQRTKGWIEAK